MGYSFVALNIVMWLIVFGVQQWESTTERISQRRKWSKDNPQRTFLYLQDWHTGSWGDLIGLSFIDFVFGHIFLRGLDTYAVIAAIVSFGVTCFFHSVWKRGTPNAGYPYDGKLSKSGTLHLLYTFFQVLIVTYLFLSINELNKNLFMALHIGVVIYALSFLMDYRQGKFSWMNFKKLPGRF